MSLDISIYAIQEIDKDNLIIFDDISRAFLSLIRCLSEEEDNCELQQIATISNVDIAVIKNMSTWRIWEKQYGGFSTKDEEQKFIYEYNLACDNSWQDIDLVLSCFNNLNNALSNDLFFESRIKYKLEWLQASDYFKNYDKNVKINEHLVDKNFGWDLRNIIDFLTSIKKENIKFVRLQIN